MLGLGAMARVLREIREDVAAVRDRDPAARGVGTVEILTSYAGVHAILSHRVSHALHEAGVPVLPRVLVERRAGSLTGIEIHPAAQHRAATSSSTTAAGVVIGETAEIGDRVTLYQGVTLGGTGFARGKRHPTDRGQRHDRLRREAARARSRSATAPRSAPTRS